jgi:formylmethanofuran--tetrahydromethanopterin N-formyltransferase
MSGVLTPRRRPPLRCMGEIMDLNGVYIQDTFAEAWDLEVARLILTGISDDVVAEAAGQFAGAAGSSELGSRINAGVERMMSPQETPDGRPGVALSVTMPPGKRDALLAELSLRVVLATLAPTVAIFDGMVESVSRRASLDLYAVTAERWASYDEDRIVAGRRMCAVPTTVGEFLYEKTISLSTEGTDGHIVCFAENAAAAVLAITASRAALVGVDGVAPMGMGLEQIFREYDYVPALKGRIENSRVPEGVGAILNLLMFGASAALMRQAMKAAILAATTVAGVRQIGAMNFGGEFGKHKYVLRELVG